MIPKWGQWAEKDGILSRQFGSYDEYVELQRSKLRQVGKQCTHTNLLQGLATRIDGIAPGSSVLCLGARTGEEVTVFLAKGCFAVGIDLEPGPDNRYVVHGDFHELPYPDACVDCVYTNALDHALDLLHVLREARRVLRGSGLFLWDVASPERGPKRWESAWWESIDDLLPLAERAGFALYERRPFVLPWKGEQLRLGVA